MAVSLWGISRRFQRLSPSLGQVTYVLLTRPPLSTRYLAAPGFALDLHVLGTPPAFILSQDQTLRRFQQPHKAALYPFSQGCARPVTSAVVKLPQGRKPPTFSGRR